MRLPLISKKRVAVFALSLALLVPIAHAILPAFAVTWLISGSNLLLADAVMAQVGVIAGVLWYDCNGMTLSACRTTSASINPDSLDSVMGKKPIVVKLKPDAQRQNPNPNTWDSATSSNRTPTPKTSFAQNAAYQPNFVNVKADDLVYNSMDTPVEYYASTPTGSGTTIYKTTYLTPSSKVNPGAPYSSYLNWTLTSGTQSGKNFTVYSKSELVPYVCPAGYTLVGGACNLTAAENVKKPSSATCEVLYYAGTQTYDFDSKNPNCDGMAAQLASGSTLSSPATSTGEKLTLTPTANGGFNICQTQPDGSWKCVQTGPYNPSAGGYPGQSLTSGNGGTTGGGTTTGTGTTGTGTTGTGTTGTGTGTSTGTGTGSCGGSGQVKCGIDDSGLTGQSADLTSSLAGVDTAHSNVMSSLRDHLPTAPSWTWSLPIQPVSCQPLNLSYARFSFNVNWCPYIPLLQQALSFLAYCFTALKLFEIAFKPAKRS